MSVDFRSSISFSMVLNLCAISSFIFLEAFVAAMQFSCMPCGSTRTTHMQMSYLSAILTQECFAALLLSDGLGS